MPMAGPRGLRILAEAKISVYFNAGPRVYVHKGVLAGMFRLRRHGDFLGHGKMLPVVSFVVLSGVGDCGGTS